MGPFGTPADQSVNYQGSGAIGSVSTIASLRKLG